MASLSNPNSLRKNHQGEAMLTRERKAKNKLLLSKDTEKNFLATNVKVCTGTTLSTIGQHKAV